MDGTRPRARNSRDGAQGQPFGHLPEKIHFYAACPRIDFETTVDWKEHQHLLKAHFPMDVHTDEATFEIQFGNVTRKTHQNTSWEQARFESCGQKSGSMFPRITTASAC